MEGIAWFVGIMLATSWPLIFTIIDGKKQGSAKTAKTDVCQKTNTCQKAIVRQSVNVAQKANTCQKPQPLMVTRSSSSCSKSRYNIPSSR